MGQVTSTGFNNNTATRSINGGNIERPYQDKTTGDWYLYNGSPTTYQFADRNVGGYQNAQQNYTKLDNYQGYNSLADALNAANSSNGKLKVGIADGYSYDRNPAGNYQDIVNYAPMYYTYDNPDATTQQTTNTTRQGVRTETDANGITRSYDAQGNLIYSSDPSEASSITGNGTTAGQQTQVQDYTDPRLAALENANLAARQNMNSLLQKYTDPTSSYMQPFSLDKQIDAYDNLLQDASDSFGTHNFIDMEKDYASAEKRLAEAQDNYNFMQQGVKTALENYNRQNSVLGGMLESQLPIYNLANEQYFNAMKQGVPQSDEAYRKQVQDALMDYQESRLNPTYAKQADALATRLANQGLTQGSNVYGQEWDTFNRGKNDAYQSAYNNAIALGEDAIQGQFNRDLARYQQIAQDYMNTSSQALQAGKNWSDALNSAMNPINSAYSNVNSAMGLINDAQSNYNNVFATDIDNYSKGEQAYAANLQGQAAIISAQASAALAARQQQQNELQGLLGDVSPNNNTGTNTLLANFLESHPEQKAQAEANYARGKELAAKYKQEQEAAAAAS